jgi:hypothetical protein
MVVSGQLIFLYEHETDAPAERLKLDSGLGSIQWNDVVLVPDGGQVRVDVGCLPHRTQLTHLQNN